MHDVPSMPLTRSLATAADTDRLGRALAQACAAHVASITATGLQVNLRGDLGAGKTALVRAWLRALGVRGPIRSPTFAVLEPYVVGLPQAAVGREGLEAQANSSLDFYHFDFYRFADPAEFSSAGFREQFGPGRVCAIEWPEKAGDRLPTADLTITLEVEGDGRRATLEAASTLGHACLASALKEFDSTAAA
ncbi:MAG TPA: tRNA (adenosine(37)-N6)-threonylcarbamoyltransferase complex ATPase subunit type 1 TsaE [Burkholderiaceae bacterium]|nr:tRNA (adenosine(37)-N6)-threonylcarbamoyltransferase complex ATPase subunit type 1 TsaE [Burkholderiaceae bacterium]HQR69042.1 tRNA (adenosine(37)-N6)-threonylcarbamoyltransferase complex ATPase subunit type 1 TsaE [Burkholderiaceae bacterium]